MRFADEFRICTNVNSTIVDPQKFDARFAGGLQRRRRIQSAKFVALARSSNISASRRQC